MSIELNNDKNKVLCPTCKNHSVGKDSETFRTHSYVQMLSDIAHCYQEQLNGSLKCIGCLNVAGLRCLTCNENYCQEHTGLFRFGMLLILASLPFQSLDFK